MERTRRQSRRTTTSSTSPPQQQPTIPVLKVGSKTDVKKLAGAIARFAREGVRCIQVRVIGAGADWQLDKAIATAGPWLASARIELSLTLSWIDIEIEGLERSGIEKCIHCLPMVPAKS